MNEKEFNALPLAQRKAAQQRLIDQGLYSGSPDGKWGNGTDTGFKAEEKRRIDDAERARKAAADQDEKSRRLKIDETKAEAEAEERRAAAQRVRQATEEAQAKAARKAKYNEEAGSGLGIGTDIAASIGAPAVTGIAGYKGGQAINLGLDKAQEFRNKTLAGAAEDRIRGLTTREGAREGTRLAGAMPISGSTGRVMSRMVPHLGLGAFGLGKGAATLYDAYTNEDDPFYAHEAKKAAGLGYIGAGAGMMKAGAGYASSPGVSPDARSLAIINSNQLRRNGVPGASAPPEVADKGALTAVEPEAAPKALPAPDKAPASAASAEKRTHANRLIAAAKQADASGPLTKQKAVDHLLAEGNITPDNRMAVAAELGIKPGPRFSERITAAVKNMAKSRGASALLGPIIAGGTAYMATPGKAEAATGEAGANRDEALTNAGIAAGIAGGAQRYLPKALKFIGERTGPMMLSDMATDLGHYLQGKGIMRSPGQIVADRSGASEVPSPNPLRSTPMPGNQYYPLSGDAAINDAMDVVQRANGGRVTGGLHFDGGGRTDNIPLDVVPGTYIVPADIVSALGQGNTLAGIKVLDNMFPPQSDFSGGGGKSRSSGGGQGGKQDGRVPIIAAGGEFQVDPRHVAALGGGNVTKGADILDAFIKDVRKQHIETLSSLPSPAQ